MNNLAEQTEFAALRERLEQRLQVELEGINDRFEPADHSLKRFGINLRPPTPPGWKEPIQMFTLQLEGK